MLNKTMDDMFRQEYRDARMELAAAWEEFNEVTDPALVDIALMRITAAEYRLRSVIARRRYMELCELKRSRGEMPSDRIDANDFRGSVCGADCRAVFGGGKG